MLQAVHVVDLVQPLVLAVEATTVLSHVGCRRSLVSLALCTDDL
jgi:hypothetical protein